MCDQWDEDVAAVDMLYDDIGDRGVNLLENLLRIAGEAGTFQKHPQHGRPR
jgi:hypothetical protein